MTTLTKIHGFFARCGSHLWTIIKKLPFLNTSKRWTCDDVKTSRICCNPDHVDSVHPNKDPFRLNNVFGYNAASSKLKKIIESKSANAPLSNSDGHKIWCYLYFNRCKTVYLKQNLKNIHFRWNAFTKNSSRPIRRLVSYRQGQRCQIRLRNKHRAPDDANSHGQES